MNPIELSNYFEQHNVALELVDNDIVCKAPRGFLTTELIAYLRQHKVELIQILQQKQGGRYIGPRSDSSPCVTSFAQQRLWFLDQFEPDNPFYIMPMALRLTGRLNQTALQRTLTEIVLRHEVLRTTFSQTGGVPMQVIHAAQEVALPLTDLRHLAAPGRELVVQQQVRTEERTPFNLALGPLLRVQLLRLDQNEHVLLTSLHHIVSDGWSTSVFVREIGALYAALVKGESSPLPPLRLQYGDFAHWQRQWLSGEVLKRQLDYWQQRLDGAPPLLALPTDRPRPAVQTYHGDFVAFTLDAELSQGLHVLGRRHQATLFMTLCAAFNVLLANYSGQDDICIGTPIANRNRSELEDLIGFFVNTMVLRTHVDRNTDFEQLLVSVREHLLDAYAHQDLPFEQLVDVLRPQRQTAHSPLFQAMLVLQNTPPHSLQLPDLDMEVLPKDVKSAKFDLSLYVNERGQQLHCELEYNTDLFDSSTIERMADHFRHLLQLVVSNPSACIGSLVLLSDAERTQQLLHWNDTAVAYPRHLCIAQLFESQVEKAPQALALVVGSERVSYGELNARANRLAHKLRAQGVLPGQLAGICMGRTSDMIVAIFAVLKVGGAYVPLDPAYPPERLHYMVRDSGAVVILSNQGCQSIVADWGVPLCLTGNDNDYSADNLPAFAQPNDLAYIIYTSGSTGCPKGIFIEQRGVVAMLHWARDAFSAEQRSGMLAATSISFDVSVFEIFAALCLGTRLILVDSVLHFAQLRDKSEVSFINSVPSAMVQLIKNHEIPATVQVVALAGEALSNTLVQSVYQAGVAHVYNLYGPSEITVFASVCRVPQVASQMVTIGRPLSNFRLYILNAWQQMVPIGVAGELYIAGDSLARGYLNQPELTREAFVPDPFSKIASARLYRTGDLVRYFANGEIEFLGRIDFQIKVRGYRIEPGEIEAVLLKHPQVQEALVLVKGDDENRQLVAYFVCRSDETAPTGSQLREHLQESLPHYMLPSHFILLDKFPISPNGKIDRQKLPMPLIQYDEQGFVAPRNRLEQQLSQIWSEVLGSQMPERAPGQKLIGIHDNFFALGGHSLLATQVISRLRSELATDVPLRLMFETPTLESMAQRLQSMLKNAVPDTEPALTPAPRGAALALSFAQQRLWFLDQLEPGSSFYNMASVLRADGQLNPGALEATLNKIVDRHEILRTTFRTVDGRPSQVVGSVQKLPLPLIDLSSLPHAERQAKVQWLVKDETSTSFDLTQGPLIRAKLIRLAAQQHIIVLTLHHIVTDGWSLGVLVNEVKVLYSALIQGQTTTLPTVSPLPPLPLQYADFVHWQRTWLSGEQLQKQLDYWKNRLEGAATLLALPTDHPRSALQTFRGARHAFRVDASTSRGLHELAQRADSTLFMVLAAVFNVLLARYSGQTDICIGTPIANRNRAQFEPLIGFFVNILVLRSQIDSNQSFMQLLHQIRNSALDMYAHQDLPFEKLIDALHLERQLAHAPLFQVMLAMQNMPIRTCELPGVVLTPLNNENHTAKYDLSWYVIEQDGELSCELEYNTDLFEAATIRRLAAHLCRLMHAVTTQDDTALGLLPLLDTDEREQLLVRWNNTATHFPQTLLHQLFEEQVRRKPNQVALVFEQTRLNFNQLNERANRLAHYLQQQGAGPNTLVALCCERSLEMVVALLAILKASAAYVPLDPAYPSDRLSFMLEDAQPIILLTQQHLRANFHNLKLPAFCLDSEWAVLAGQPHYNLAPALTGHPAQSEQLAYVIYTSGSTGKPKGVQLSHRSALNFLTTMQQSLAFSVDEIFLCLTSLSFDIAFLELFLPLTHGARCVLVTRDVTVDPEKLADLIDREHVSVMQATPISWRMLADHRWPQRIGQMKALCGGEALPLDLANRILAQVQVLWNMYGPTETTVWSSQKVFRKPTRHITIGRPLGNTRLYVLDPFLNPAPIGVPGELYIGGVGLARGYWGRFELTASSFVPDPFSETPGARMYKTGDLVRFLADGELEYLNRLDDQVKLRGFRIELSEIERTLIELPEVAQAVVMLRDDSGSSKQLTAYVVEDSNAMHGRRSMDFSLFYFGADNVDAHDKYRFYLESAKFADEHGFEAVWTPERHFHQVGSLYPNPALLNAALATITKRIKLRAGSVVLPLHHPVRIAEEWAVVDNLSHGRAGIAIATGWHPRDFVLAPDKFALEARQSATREGIQTLKTLWAGEPMSMRDGIGNMTEIKIFPRPLQAQLPIWITAAGNIDIFIFAGRIGANLLTHLLGQTIEELAKKIGIYRQTLAEHGFDPASRRVTIMVHTYVGSDFAATLARAMQPFMNYMRAHLGLMESLVKSLNIKVEHVNSGNLENAIEFAFERYTRIASLIGTPETCLKVVMQLKEAGVDEIGCLIDWMDSADASAALPHLHQLQLKARTLPMSEAELLRHCKSKLPDYMLPGAFVMMNHMPLTPNGKVDRRALPAPVRNKKEIVYAAPCTATEMALLEVWAQVLGRTHIGVDDNFFTVGGDSILAIQVIAKARTVGIYFSPKQLFEYPTVAELAKVVKFNSSVVAEQGLVQGEALLTPIQQWFFGLKLPALEHYNQSLLVVVNQPLDMPLLRQVVDILFLQHDALRMRFEHRNGHWQAHHVEPHIIQHELLKTFDLTDLETPQQELEFVRLAEQLQDDCQLAMGPLFRVAYFRFSAKQGRLLFICHHLIIDGLSWRTLLGDLQQAYTQGQQGQAMILPLKTSSFKEWGNQLQAYIASGALQYELPYWRKAAALMTPLPFDRQPEPGITFAPLVFQLSENDTVALVSNVPQAYRTQVNDVLLTALALAISEWADSDSVSFNLEGHGREDLFPQHDFSRTVGWFTSMFPVRLELGVSGNYGQILKSIKEQLRAIPQKGIGYGLLRYLGHDPVLSAQSNCAICFNYLGQTDQVFSGSSLLQPIPAFHGERSSRLNPGPHDLEINGIIESARLSISFDWSRGRFQQAAVAAFANNFMRHLKAIIEHCSGGSQAYTPSDFPHAELSQTTLDSLYDGYNFRADPIEDIYQLTPMQQGVLLHSLTHPESGMYVQQMRYSITAGIDLDAFLQALHILTGRYGILRSAVIWEGLDYPLNLIYKQCEPVLEQLDWRDRPALEQQHLLCQFLHQDRIRGFDFQRPPLQRFALLQTGDDRYEFVWTYQYILFDGWSTATLLREFLATYAVLVSKQSPVLPGVKPFRDYLGWLRKQDLTQAEAFWRAQLAGFDVPTPLMIDRHHALPATPSSHRLSFDDDFTRRAIRFTSALGVTVNTLIQGVWGILLSRYSQQSDVLFGITVSGRPAEVPDIEAMVGLFINSLPLRMEILPAMVLGDWLQALQTKNVEMRQYEYTPLTRIQAVTSVAAGTPLFNSVMVYENFPVEGLLQQGASSALKISEIKVEEQTNYLLTLVVSVGSTIEVVFRHDSARIMPAAILRLAGHFSELLQAMISDPLSQIGHLPLLTEAERHQVLLAFNDTDRAYPLNRNMVQLFEDQVALTPHAVAMLAGEERLSYARLNQRANRLAHHLRAQGVARGTLVGVCFDRNADLIVALLAVLKAGAAYVPLDPTYPLERLHFMLQDSQAGQVLTNARWQNLFTSAAVPLCLIAPYDQYSDENLLAEEGAQAHDLAYVIYTSGSTGVPKGVAIEHRSVVTMLHWGRDTFSPQQRACMLAATSVCFDISVFEIFMPLCWGTSLVIVENAMHFADLTDKSVVSFINTVPSAMKQLIRDVIIPDSVQVVVLAGEPLSRALVQSVYEAGVPAVYNLYGPSEDTVYSTFVRVPEAKDSAITIGRPVSNTQLYILDQQMQPLPVGIAGELYLGGAGLAREYLNRPDLTREKFVVNPFNSIQTGARLYRTGDLARYREDGEVEFLGRIDHQIKIRGYRIETGEIESELLTLTQVREALVVVYSDGDEPYMVAYCVCQTGGQTGQPALSGDELRQQLQRRMPGYMVPAHVMVLAQFPLTANGKINRNALPLPGDGMSTENLGYAPPANDTERAIADVWQELLGGRRVGANDHFFDLGGNSLQMLQMKTRLNAINRSGKPLALTDLFAYVTVRDLARRIAQNSDDDAASMQKVVDRAARQKAALKNSKQKKLRMKNDE